MISQAVNLVATIGLAPLWLACVSGWAAVVAVSAALPPRKVRR